MKVLVTGATGFVGSHTCDLLTQEGHEVFCQARNKKKFEEFKIPGTLIEGTISPRGKHDWIDKLPKDLEAVIYTVGVVHAFNHKDFLEHNNEAFKSFCNDLSEKYKKIKMVFISSLAATGPSLQGHPVNEESPNLPVSSYGISKNEAEHFLKQFLPEKWTATIIRPPMVIGPRDPAVLDIFKMVRSRIIAFPGFDGLENRYSFVSVFDLTRLIVSSLSHAPHDQKYETFFASFPQIITYRQIIDKIAQLDEKKFLVKLPLPRFILPPIAYIIKGLHKIFKINFRLTPDKVNEITQECWTCCSRKSVEEIKITYEWNFERTIEATYKDYLQRQWL